MSIVVDIGNSRIKVAQFKDQQLLNVCFIQARQHDT